MDDFGNDYSDQDDDSSGPYEPYIPYSCKHGIEGDNCPDCDDEIESAGGIDKCLNCGRYKSGNSLTKDQVCKIPCQNPNEY